MPQGETTEARTIEANGTTYVVKDLLGAGSAGEVFSAVEQNGEREVAVKFLHAEGSKDQQIDQRFVREISILEKLAHPNIVKYFGCGVSDEGLYFVMEKVPFGSLKEVIRQRERLNWRQAVEATIHICNGLQHAHARGIVHRDLKPANIFLSEDGNLKVGDFGLAFDEAAGRLTVDGTTVGTVEYMSPELVQGETVDHRSDLYAVGCMLFEMLAGHAPFIGPTPFDVMGMHVDANVPSIRDISHGTPIEVDQMIKRLMAKSVDDRPDSALAVCEELASLIGFDLSKLETAPVQTNSNAEIPHKPLEDSGGAAAKTAPKSLSERLAPTVDERQVSPVALIVIGVILLVLIIAVVVLQPRS